MSVQLHELPTSGTVPSNAFMLLKREVLGQNLDYKVDVGTLFAPYINRNTEVGTDIGDFFQLINVAGNPGLPAVDGSQLLNIIGEIASDSQRGINFLSDDITSTSNATSGQTAATPKAVRDLGFTKLNNTGGDMTGNITFNNNLGIRVRAINNSPITLASLDGSNTALYGNNGIANVKMTASETFSIRNSSNADVFTFNTLTGALTGFYADKIDTIPAGNLSSLNVQSALNELDSEKLSTSAASSTYLTQSSAASNYLTISNAASAYLGINATASNAAQLGGVAASSYLTEAEGNANYLGASSKAADSELLDGLNSTSYARRDAAYTQTGTVAFNDDVDLRFGTSGSGDSEIFYSGALNNLIVRLGANANNFIIQDGANTRLTLSKTSGDLTVSGNVTANSDERLKNDFKVIGSALDKVERLTGYTYIRTDIETDRQTGLKAQEVQKVLPEAVVEGDDGTLSLAYGNMVGLLVEAIKDLSKRVNELEGG